MVQSQRLILTGLIGIGLLVSAHLVDQAQFGRANVVMVYMLAVVVVAALRGLVPATVLSLLGLPLFQVFDVPPTFQFNSNELAHTFPLAVMLVTALTVSNLAGRLRQQREESDERAARMAALYALAVELASDGGEASVPQVLARHVARAFRVPIDPEEAQAGGIEAIRARVPGSRRDDHLEAMLHLARQAEERAGLRQRLQDTELRAQRESLRSSILGAVSHDLRTPLTAIIGASSSLLSDERGFTPDARRRLLELVHDEAEGMQRQVENLLDLARLRSGAGAKLDTWQAIEEIVGSALPAVRRRHADHRFRVQIPADLPLIRCDGVLMERVLVNLLENAARFSPAGDEVVVEAGIHGGCLELVVADHGAGIGPAMRDQVFEPFFRAGPAGRSGLGLAICRGIVEAHGGSIRIEDNAGGGTRMVVALPLPGEGPVPPEPEPEDEP